MLQSLFARAVMDHGKEDDSFWLDYIAWMQSQGNLTKAHNLHMEAMKTLKDTTQFVLKYNQLGVSNK